MNSSLHTGVLIKMKGCPVSRFKLTWSQGLVPLIRVRPLVQGVSTFIRVPDFCTSNSTPYKNEQSHGMHVTVQRIL